MLGSAQIRCEADGLDLVYAGDIGGSGPRASLTAEALVPVTCETLALRALYGHPRYVFPPREQLLEKVSAFVEKTLGQGKTPVLVAAALGEAQDVVRYLGGRHVLRLHPTAFRACEVYVAQGVPCRARVPLGGERGCGGGSTHPRLSRLGLGEHRVCALSGRAVDGIASADEALPLADHAGFEDLLEGWCARERAGPTPSTGTPRRARPAAPEPRDRRNRHPRAAPASPARSLSAARISRLPLLESVDSTPRGLAA